ncbi:aminoacyl-tRNA hydrolase [Rubinisphaera margarita]|uniref:aminoacyl-tRNA hydrolase n=1 Tax=Rubinisphaera margarita TaxID=2909586 RepID=UPI001EE8A387|nr:aminoacyl-tRNA hydrolase [Rubinisphaera margarita]MCG6154754.1 aminoacyl-tRNA hydrolase [Rubinisphaera margarita]
MKAVVGLGNPGRRYQGTRHNIGFLVLDELARRHAASPSSLRHDSEIKEIFLGGEKIVLAAPQTYMNLSGSAVASLVNFHKLPLEDLLVISDDLNLPPGQLRLRASGSSGGQKGLKDIALRLGTEDFARLRFGIGRPSGPMDISAYVLQKFSGDEDDIIQEAIQRAADGVELWIQSGAVEAMNRVNQKA